MAQLKASDFAPVNLKAFEQDAIARPTVTYWQDAWRRLRKNPLAMFSLGILIFFTIMIIIGSWLSGHDYITINSVVNNQSPGSEYWFGTDTLGRDLFSRIWVGARVSLIVALACTGVQIVIGCAYGGIMAYFGGWVDEVLMRILEIITSMPSLLITILVMMVIGGDMFGLLAAMCITSWCATARQMRGQFMQLRESEYIMAAEILGAKPTRVILRHLLPNTLSILILNVTSSIPGYIFTEAGLSFLGIGLEAPAISLGVLISEGKAKMSFYPFQLFFPALILCLIVLAFNLFGDGLRDALDPKLRS